MELRGGGSRGEGQDRLLGCQEEKSYFRNLARMRSLFSKFEYLSSESKTFIQPSLDLTHSYSTKNSFNEGAVHATPSLLPFPSMICPNLIFPPALL